jgi:transcriptional regulator with XRE-family HTH domain
MMVLQEPAQGVRRAPSRHEYPLGIQGNQGFNAAFWHGCLSQIGTYETVLPQTVLRINRDVVDSSGQNHHQLVIFPGWHGATMPRSWQGATHNMARASTKTAAPRRQITPQETPPPPASAISPEAADFARRLHKALSARGMTQSELAAEVWGRRRAWVGEKEAMVARNRDRVSVYLAGKGMPREAHLVRIAEVLRVDPADLLPGHQAGPKLPPPASLVMLPRQQARLTVNTVIPVDLALRITQLIEKAQRGGDAD